MDIEDLTKVLNEMDLPKSRLDLSSESNLRWLLRNIWIRNNDHPFCDTATREIKLLLNRHNGQA